MHTAETLAKQQQQMQECLDTFIAILCRNPEPFNHVPVGAHKWPNEQTDIDQAG